MLAPIHRRFLTGSIRTRSFSSTKAMFAVNPPKDHKPTFFYSKQLPRLPVPPLQQTAAIYLQSLKPFINDSKEVQQREELLKDFIKPGGLGEKLQQRLIDVDRSVPYNWLDDHFWLAKAYHEWRVPLIINSNWYILCKDDPNIPQLPGDIVGFTEWQIKRAAKVTQRVLLFKDNLEAERIPPDVSRAGAFDMHQYTRIFGITRIPQHGCDSLNHVSFPPTSKHIIVMIKDQFYKVPVYDAEGKSLNQAELELQIKLVVDDFNSTSQIDDPIGILTASDRDHWAIAREDLLLAHPSNRATLTEIEDALFLVALEDYSVENNRDIYNRVAFHGKNGHNRWFDKAISIIVENNARVGINGEHSPCDALIPAILFDYALAEALDPKADPKSSSAEKPIRLRFITDGKVKEHIAKAQVHINELISDSIPIVHWYESYGTDWIKKVAKISPDAYLQMAIQLAYYRTHGHHTATYETASTRGFKNGRTDVIRTLSVDSKAFCESVVSFTDPSKRYELLIKATAAHNTYTKDASMGKGCDRHLLGLRLLLQPGESHPFFTDPLFNESQKYELSTSTLIAGERFNGTGFGAMYPDGYGINYLPGANVIKFGIEVKKSSKKSDLSEFTRNLDLAMNEMRGIVETQSKNSNL